MAIVKVQRRLDNPVDTICLVYPESRRAWVQQPVPKHVWAILSEREGGKAYFIGTWRAIDQRWEIAEQVPDQKW